MVNDIVLVDDCSNDKTYNVALDLGLKHIVRHDVNLGYGANQKTCYDYALSLQADVIIMLHPDYQYDPKLIPCIIEKIKRKNIGFSMKAIEENMFDIAGVRVICSFQEDIYTMADLLLQQDDIILVEKKDYIAHPKDNGYRSLHLIVDVPIFLSNEKRHMKVEVQLRTIAMDFWASLEHKLRYKKHINNSEEIADKLKHVADVITEMDCEMQDIRHMIEFIDDNTES